MSGLAGILAHRHEPGVYRWRAAFSAEDVARAVKQAGWRFGYVDGWQHQTRGEFLTAVGDALGFPDYYGRNLDAFHDCLRELDGSTVLLWDGWGTLARADQHAFALIHAILLDHSGALTTLLRGDGPQVEVDWLD